MDPAINGRKIRSRLGVVPQDDALDSELSVLENLQIYGRYFGLSKSAIVQRSAELLKFAELTDRATERVDALSGGMRRRLTIARALINSPDLLLLDEPTTGLDPQARHLLWDRLFQLKQAGVTLILTTHYMDEAEQLCDRIVVIDRGVIVAHGTPRELIDRYTSREVLEVRFDAGTEVMSAEKIRAAGIGDRTEVLAARLLCSTDDGEAALAAVHRLGLPLFLPDYLYQKTFCRDKKLDEFKALSEVDLMRDVSSPVLDSLELRRRKGESSVSPDLACTHLNKGRTG
jgi:lipooligosaccharide transport system ATP-binding protein